MMTPTTAAAMRSHMMADPPGGHGMKMAEDMPMPDMAAKHDAAHEGDDAEHEHPAARMHAVSDFEVRGTDLWPDADLELRTESDGLSFEGYALVWNKWSLPIPGGPRGAFRETFRDGSMTRTLARNPDIVLTSQHNLMTLPLGRTRAGTFRLAADAHGLLTAGELPDNEVGRPVRDAIRRKDISGMSIRFRVPSKAGEVWASDFSEREIVEAALGGEISIATFPAYLDTTATVRHIAEMAEVSVDDLAEAFVVLRNPEGKLTNDQRDILMTAVNAKVDEPYISPKLARMQERLASASTG